MMRFVPYASLLCVFCAGYALDAASKDHWDFRDEHPHHEKHDKDHDDHDGGDHGWKGGRPVIVDDDRVIIRRYYVERPYYRCPPGLAKKRNGCMPPGQYKKYVVGEYLPGSVVYEPLPHELLVRLGPVPVGARYVRVDKDVYLISEGTKKILDAMVLFSGVD